MCATVTLLPRRRRPPFMCMPQLTSVTAIVSAPHASIASSLRASISPEMSDILTANRPPNPQQTSASGSGHVDAPRTPASSAFGSPSTPRPRRPWQQAW